MASLKDFLNQKKFDKNVDAEKSNIEENLKKYQSMNRSDLMSELLKEASKMKASGKLDNESLKKLKTTLLPMLSDEQKALLDNILDEIERT